MKFLATIYLITQEQVFIEMNENIAFLRDMDCEQKDNACPSKYQKSNIYRIIDADNFDDAELKLMAYLNNKGIKGYAYEIEDEII